MQGVVVGVVANADGAVHQTEVRPWGNHGGAQLFHHYYSRSSLDYRSTQPQHIPVDYRHGSAVGAVVFLQRSHGNLWAVGEVAEVERLPIERSLYFSPSIDTDSDGRDIELRALAITPEPATCALGTVQFIPGTLREVVRRTRQQVGDPWDLLTAAAAHRGGTSVVVDTTPVASPVVEQRSAPVYYSALPLPTVVGRPTSEHRSSRPAPQRPARAQRYRIVDGERVPIEHRPGRILGVS